MNEEVVVGPRHGDLGHPAALSDRLVRLGFETSKEELVTPGRGRGPPIRVGTQARVLAVAADGVRQALARFLAGPGEPVTHVLVADPSYGRP